MNIVFLLIILLNPLFVYAGELKIGALATSQCNEGGANINLEYIGHLSKKVLLGNPFIGTDINLSGYTSSVYGGIVWQKNFENNFFIQASLGGAVHNGKLKKDLKQKSGQRKSRTFGSRILFRESIDLGYKFANNNKISLFIDHISNANIIPPNHGLTNIGIRYGIAI